ncbi:MAG: sigma-70 family RNA polymerase sigma factor [Actinomycetota bacterium]
MDRGEMDEAIYRQHKHDLIRYATVLVGPSDAEDVLSAVIARVYKSRRTLSDLDEPRPYLMKAVFHESLDRKKRKQTLPLVDQAIEPTKSRPEVLEAVKELPVQQRAVVFLTYWMGMPSDEAARYMGCQPSTARRYLHLARKKLEGALADA